MSSLAHFCPLSFVRRVDARDQSRTLPATQAAWARASQCPALTRALWQAVWHNDTVEVERLLALGADPERPLDAGVGRTLGNMVLVATRGRNLRAVRALLANGANPNKRDSEQKTALHYATDPDIVRALVEAGANVNARDYQGETPFISAVARGSSIEVLQTFIDAGANPLLQDRAGHNALLHARELVHTRTVSARRRGEIWDFVRAALAQARQRQRTP